MHLLIFTLAAAIAAVQGACPFSPSSCPVEVDSTLDIFYFDLEDRSSCQHQCQTLSACNNFTILPASDKKHTKCFLFQSCAAKEACPNCVSGGEEPPYYDCTKGAPISHETAEGLQLFKSAVSYLTSSWLTAVGGKATADSYTCPTDVENMLQIFYFDADDSESCQHQCTAIAECEYWTQKKVQDTPHPHNKCFLYQHCDKHEACAPDCLNGESM